MKNKYCIEDDLIEALCSGLVDSENGLHAQLQ